MTISLGRPVLPAAARLSLVLEGVTNAAVDARGGGDDGASTRIGTGDAHSKGRESQHRQSAADTWPAGDAAVADASPPGARAGAAAAVRSPVCPPAQNARSRRTPGRRVALLALVAIAAIALGGCTSQQGVPNVNVQIGNGQASSGGGQFALSLQLLIVLTVLAIVPSILLMATSFTRIVVVLSLLRSAIGIPQLPPNQVLLGLSLFLTLFIMAPVWNRINVNALQPYMNGTITQDEAFQNGQQPLREFMLAQTKEEDLAVFLDLAKTPRPKTQADVPTEVLLPAFVMSELKTAFTMGFLLFIPFLVIDLIVASALMSMGMLMVSPTQIALPFKLLLFVLVDGWVLIVQSLVRSFS